MNNQPTTSLIQLETDGCIARVTLARPDKYNALNVQMITEPDRGVFRTAENSVGVTGKLTSEDGKPSSEFSFSLEKASISVLEQTSI